ncbi:MAG: tRNA (guanosine(46)-N7)-methyltransferase TrmB [Pseudomonadales bacterium]|jgi:tRNA (guanine-N7-)-methyltransferase|nr:tRNA (guanosine(46)-N7)-methyltransferase TrmB [Pseudomonadales bacterium]
MTPEHSTLVAMRTIKSFVVRTGRMTASQQEAYDSYLPRYGLHIEDGPLDQQQAFGRLAPLVLEIGFGMGQSLIAMAKAHPGWDYIGVEVHPPGIGNLLRGIHDEGLSNLRVYRGDAKDVLAINIAEQQLSRLQIFFPDPWHKTRHHKRRLIQADFIQSVLPKLAPGGVIHLATDWEPYAQQMMAVLSAFPDLGNVFGAGQWASTHERPLTKFEKRGQKLGHGVWDLVFAKRVP